MKRKMCLGGGLLLVASSAIITLAACSSFNLHKDNVIRNLSKTDTFEQDNKTYSMVEFSKDNPVQSGDYIIGGATKAGAVGLITSYNTDKYYNTTTNLPTEANGTSYLIFTITLLEDDTYTIYDNTNKWFVCGAGSGSIAYDEVGNNSKRFWTYDSTKSYFVNTVSADNQGKCLSYNSSANKVAAYKSTSGQSGLVFFKEDADYKNVKFIVEGDTYDEKSVKSGDALVLPKDPTKNSDTYNNYEFDGWYDENGTKYTGGESVSSDLVLTARFIAVEKDLADIFKSTSQSSISTFDYQYKNTLEISDLIEETLPNGTTSSTGSFTLTDISSKSSRTNKTTFGNTKQNASIKFDNKSLNTNLSISFPFDASQSPYSTIKIVIIGEKGNIEHINDSEKGNYTYNSLEDEKTIGYIKSFEIVWNEIKPYCNVYIGDLTVSSQMPVGEIKSSNFDNLAIVYAFKYTFDKLDNISSFGAICTEDIALIPSDGTSTFDSSVLKVVTPYNSKYNEVGYSIGLHIDKETIADTYNKKYYFAAYFEIDGKNYFSNVHETTFEESLVSSIKTFKLNESIKTDFEEYFGIAK